MKMHMTKTLGRGRPSKKSGSQNFSTRLPLALYEQVKAMAEAQRRSITSMLIILLEAGLSRTQGTK